MKKPANKIIKPAAATCRECKKEVLDNYQIIETKRKDKIYICNECLKKEREERRARDSH